MSSGHGDTGAGDVLSVLLVLKPDPELDLEAGERLIRQLRAELAELDIESVGLAGDGTAPDDAKGADPVTVGAVIVALSASGEAFHHSHRDRTRVARPPLPGTPDLSDD